MRADRARSDQFHRALCSTLVRTMGVCPRGAHVRLSGDTNEKPFSLGKPRVAPSSRHFFYLWPDIAFPMHKRLLVARPTAPLRFLATPTDAAHQIPHAARYLSRVIRLCLRFAVEPIFIPPARPQRNGSVEQFNGWFQPRLLQRHFTRVSALHRELLRLQETVNTQHVQRRLGGLTPEQYRRRKKLQKLPPRFVVSTDPLPIAAERVTFIRQVTPHGNIHLLSQTFKVGKRLKGQYVKAVLDTQRSQLTVYVKGRVFKRWPYPFLKK